MVLISLNIDEKVKNKVKMLGISHTGVYMRGFEVISNKNSYEWALEEQKTKLEKLSKLLNHYIGRCISLEEGIKNVVQQKKGTKK